MSRYSGKKCVICSKTFNDDDDIVVCPDCGTPYHRACYEAAGRCVADGLHASGTSWHSFQVESGNIIVCKRCNHENSPQAIFCEKCGMPTRMDDAAKNYQSQMPQTNQQTQMPQNPYIFIFDEYCGLSPEEEFDGVKLKEIAEFIGPNKRYFLPIFKNMKDRNKKFSVNLPAAFFPHYYFAYRKMYFPMLLAVLSYAILEIQVQFEYIKDSSTLIHSILSQYPALLEKLTAFASSQLWTNISNVLFLACAAASFIFAFFSNWIYYRHCIKKIKKLKSNNQTGSDLKGKFAKYGGTTIAGLLLVFILILPFVALSMAENMHLLQQ